jgi:RNA polymerase sigma-70 factor (ECF subfamily)
MRSGKRCSGSAHAVTIGGDAEFTGLVQRQWRFAFRVAYAVLRNAHDAEDAVQETFLKIYRKRAWRDIENERAFLARVAWRTAVDQKPLARLPFASAADSAERPSPLETPSKDPGPEQELIQTENYTLIHSLIDALPEDLRIVLVLSSDDELNSREIGEVLGIPEGTARTRLQRARQILYQKLAARLQSGSRSQNAWEVPYA